MPAPGSSYFVNDKSLQKTVYKHLHMHIFPDISEAKLDHLLQERLLAIFAPFNLDFDNLIHIPLLLNAVKKLAPNNTGKVIKTWLQGWATSYRMKGGEEMLHNCLMGCKNEPDNFKHYVNCPHLFALNLFFNPDTNSDPLVRLGLINPSDIELKYVCCNFSAYHALKNKIRAGIIQPPTAECIASHLNGQIAGSALRACWSVYAEAFQAEAGELSVSYRRFSLTKFIDFLVNSQVQAITDLDWFIPRRG